LIFVVTACGSDTTAPQTLSRSASGSLAVPRELHAATLLADGKVLITGGVSSTSEAPTTAELFDPSSSTFIATGSMGSIHQLPTATRLKDGKVLVAGGKNGPGSPIATAELYDPATGTFTPTGDMTTARVFILRCCSKMGRCS